MDYFIKLENLSEEATLIELERISRKLFAAPRGSAMHKGLSDLYDQAQAAYAEKQYIRNYNLTAGKGPDIIELGEIKSEVIEPNYSLTELIDVVVQSYYSDPNE